MANALYDYCQELHQCKKAWNSKPDMPPHALPVALPLAGKVQRIREIIARACQAHPSSQYNSFAFENIKAEMRRFQERAPQSITAEELTDFLKRVNSLSRGLIPLARVYTAWETEVNRDSDATPIFPDDQPHPETYLKKIIKHPDFQNLTVQQLYNLISNSLNYAGAHEALLNHPRFADLIAWQIHTLLSIAMPANLKSIMDRALAHPACDSFNPKQKLDLIRCSLANKELSLDSPWFKKWFSSPTLDPKVIYGILETAIFTERDDVIALCLKNPGIEQMEPNQIEILRDISSGEEHPCEAVSKAMTQLMERKGTT